jgi:N-methylhydantoinase B
MTEPDPVLLEIMKSLLAAVAEEMGATLGRTAFSPNIKERRDFSCAVFDPAGQMVAQAAHIPVHLGALPLSVAAGLERFTRLADGDVVVLNDPYAGGSHLPDITMVSPVYDQTAAPRLLGYVASRAHHADVGGITPGSMPLAHELYQEGLIIPPVLLQRAGQPNEGILDLIMRNSRTPEERLGDLAAQMASQQVGTARLRELATRYGRELLTTYMGHLQDYAERMVRNLIRAMPRGRFSFRDVMDDDGFATEDIPIQLAIEADGDRLRIDFTGTGGEVAGGINAVRSVTLSAVFYVVRCMLADDQVPTNAGIFRPVDVILPEGTLVHARFPHAVAAGNVETSQRIVDVLLGAFGQALPELAPAASQGTMNNITIGGDTAQPEGGSGRFAYYETIGGGMGAAYGAGGLSGVHVHMTNTLNTPAEALEYAYPLRVTRYSLRRGSGGAGRWRGGDGLVREIELLTDSQVTILSERRRHAAWGAAGGGAGAAGANWRIEGTGPEAITLPLPGKVTFHARAGDRVRIETPGGGGYGIA